MADGISFNARFVDLSPRFIVSTTVAASPALAAETVIANVTIPGNLAIMMGVVLTGWAPYTVGTSGTAVTLRIRQTGLAGTVVGTTGAMTKTATNLYADDVNGVDTAPSGAQVYALTMQVTGGAAASTVSAVVFSALVV